MRISNWSSDVCSSDLIVEQAVEQLTVVQPKAMACLVDVDGLPRLRHQSPFVVSPGFSCRQPIEIRTLGPAGVSLIRHRGGNAGLLEIGRASRRERVCQYVSISVGAGS